MAVQYDENGQPIAFYSEKPTVNQNKYAPYAGELGMDIPSYNPQPVPMAMKTTSDWGGYTADTGSSSFPNYQPTTSPQSQSMVADAGSVASGAGDVMGAAAMVPSPASPFLAGGSLALKGVGTITDIYGKYQAREDAKKQYEEMLALQKEQQRKIDEDRAIEVKRKQRQEGYFASDFAQGLEDRLASSYGGYRTPGGK